jgi:hypothetical protein
MFVCLCFNTICAHLLFRGGTKVGTVFLLLNAPDMSSTFSRSAGTAMGSPIFFLRWPFTQFYLMLLVAQMIGHLGLQR